ncbi:MAG: iron-sulfur cluster assembly protein, partial [Burkholderiaceae bacterium]
MLRQVVLEGDTLLVTITPTYSGCPAMEQMQTDIEAALQAAGLQPFRVQTTLSPAWTTDWIS